MFMSSVHVHSAEGIEERGEIMEKWTDIRRFEKAVKLL